MDSNDVRALADRLDSWTVTRPVAIEDACNAAALLRLYADRVDAAAVTGPTWPWQVEWKLPWRSGDEVPNGAYEDCVTVDEEGRMEGKEWSMGWGEDHDGIAHWIPVSVLMATIPAASLATGAGDGDALLPGASATGGPARVSVLALAERCLDASHDRRAGSQTVGALLASADMLRTLAAQLSAAVPGALPWREGLVPEETSTIAGNGLVLATRSEGTPNVAVVGPVGRAGWTNGDPTAGPFYWILVNDLVATLPEPPATAPGSGAGDGVKGGAG